MNFLIELALVVTKVRALGGVELLLGGGWKKRTFFGWGCGSAGFCLRLVGWGRGGALAPSGGAKRQAEQGGGNVCESFHELGPR